MSAKVEFGQSFKRGQARLEEPRTIAWGSFITLLVIKLGANVDLSWWLVVAPVLALVVLAALIEFVVDPLRLRRLNRA